MEKKYPKKKYGASYPAIPHKPLPEGAEGSAVSIYHVVIGMVFGISLSLFMGALDHVSQETTPTTDTTEIIEFFE